MAFAVAPAAYAGGDAHSNEAFEPHWIGGVFLGVTDTKYSTEPTYGLEAEYRATKRIGVGAVVEYLPDAGDGHEATLVLGEVHYHTDIGLRFIGGAGRDYHHGDEKPVWRLGAAYDFHVGDFHISPMTAIDFLEDDENFVAGMAFAKRF